MFCYQCEQTFQGTASIKLGVCGKNPDVAVLQDLLLYLVKGLSQIAIIGHKYNIVFINKALFTTVTNVNFDLQSIAIKIHEYVKFRDNIFTTSEVGWPGITHITSKDFSPVIDQPLKFIGFAQDIKQGYVITGFACNAIKSFVLGQPYLCSFLPMFLNC
jgi:hydroxylamine reductase (hybrid-cluster protein)